MTYKLNGTDLLLQPEGGQWLERELLGYNGHGRPIYAATRRFEIRFGPMSIAQFDQLQDFFDAQAPTGSLVVDLPRYNHASWEFRSYSGVFVQEPVASLYFEQTVSAVRMLVTNIITE